MKSIRFTTLLLLSTALPGLAETLFDDADAKAVETFLHGRFATGDAGMVIGLLDKNGTRVFAAGKLSKGSDEEINGGTVFEIGSITKTFTSLAALDMDRRGEWKLDEPVAKYLPRTVKTPEYEGNAITLRHLAAQDSGLPFNVNNFSGANMKESYDAYTTGNLYEFLKEFKLTSAPGGRFEYSNAGMSLLGHAMELASGESYESLVLSRICRPLRMNDTRVTLTSEMMPRMAIGHDINGERAPNLNLQVMAGAGALKSTANDLLKYLSAQLGFTRSRLDPLITESQMIRHTGASTYGNSAMPWVGGGVYQPPGSEFLGHAGGTVGFSAFVGFDRKQRRAVVVLSNQRKIVSGAVGWLMLQGLPLNPANLSMPVREVVGVGTALASDDQTGAVRISRVFPDSPAGKAGLSAGLLIRKINGNSIEGRSLGDCLKMMGGRIGTKVRLDLFDPERGETRTVELSCQKFITSSGKPRS